MIDVTRQTTTIQDMFQLYMYMSDVQVRQGQGDASPHHQVSLIPYLYFS